MEQHLLYYIEHVLCMPVYKHLHKLYLIIMCQLYLLADSTPHYSEEEFETSDSKLMLFIMYNCTYGIHLPALDSDALFCTLRHA